MSIIKYIKNIDSRGLSALFVLPFLLFSLTGCDFNGDVGTDTDSPSSAKKVELVFTLDGGGLEETTKSAEILSLKHSINEENIYFEDRVREAVIHIYESRSGEKVAQASEAGIPRNQPFYISTEISEGIFDIYVIANMPTTGSDPSTLLGTRNKAEEFTQKLRELNPILFHGPISDKASGGSSHETDAIYPLFPMLRVYRNQKIQFPPGFDPAVDNKLPFKPVDDSGIPEDHLLLWRTVAKLDVNFTGMLKKDDIQEIKLINGVNEYSLTTLPNNNGKTKNISNNTFDLVNKGDRLVFYTPEVIQSSTNLTWNEQTPGDLINYLVITSKRGQEYKVPIASNYTPGMGKYLDFCAGKGSVRPIFHVLRNNHYRFNLNVTTDKEIVITAEVLPWELVNSGIDFGKAEIDFDKGTGAMEGEKTILIPQQDKMKVKFTLKKPKGAIWRASVTNGLDFELLPGDGPNGATGGIADENTVYEFYVRPLKPHKGTNRLTELYITVNNEEIHLLPNQTGDPGPGKRYVFKQVESI